MSLPPLSPRKIATVLFDEYHSESWSSSRQRAAEVQPERYENSSYQIASDALAAREFLIRRNAESPIDAAVLEESDVLVLLHPCDRDYECTTSTNSPRLDESELAAITRFVERGGGLFIATEYENAKYGNNLNELLQRFGITFENTTVVDRKMGMNEEKTHVPAQATDDSRHLLTGVKTACFYRAGSCKVSNGAYLIARASADARPKAAGLIAAASFGKGRVIAVTDSDLFGDEFIERFDHLTLWLNLIYWLSGSAFAKAATSRHEIVDADPSWRRLKESVNTLRDFHVQKRQSDGTYLVEEPQHGRIDELIVAIITSIEQLETMFPNDSDYLRQVVQDISLWRGQGYGRPDFTRSLAAFNPQSDRRENAEHLAVFPMYTPNNSLNIAFEALIFMVPWYKWLADMERSWIPFVGRQLWPIAADGAGSGFRNAKFVPGNLVDHTRGYESECAVLFPDSVSTDGAASNNFGVIFCDREAMRYRRCVTACADIVNLNAPPDLVCFWASPDLVMDMFAVWDLVHDTSHSMGPLPYDPFMIRQLAPYWMYGLEELRVDLRSARVGLKLAAEGFPFGRTILYGVLFDRIFRFAISGSRVKNYDGLGGQLLFAALHKMKAVTWVNNRLTVSWSELPGAMESLSLELEELYERGATQSRVRRFVEGHKFVSKYVPPNVGSRWVDGTAATRLAENDAKAWIAEALDDEFPLGSFHTQLKRKYEMQRKGTALG